MLRVRWQEIPVVGTSSAVMSLVIEFIYTGQLTSTYAHFFELLLVANMYEMKELEKEILRLLQQILDDSNGFAGLTGKMREGKDRTRLVADFHVEGEIRLGWARWKVHSTR